MLSPGRGASISTRSSLTASPLPLPLPATPCPSPSLSITRNPKRRSHSPSSSRPSATSTDSSSLRPLPLPLPLVVCCSPTVVRMGLLSHRDSLWSEGRRLTKGFGRMHTPWASLLSEGSEGSGHVGGKGEWMVLVVGWLVVALLTPPPPLPCVLCGAAAAVLAGVELMTLWWSSKLRSSATR